MTLVHRFLSMLKTLFQPTRTERQLTDELQTFVEMSVDRKVRDGASAAQARRETLIELGGVDQVKERVRAGRPGAWLEGVGRDIAYGLRMLRRDPGFAAIAILSIGIGVGANTAIFSFADGLLMRPLPVPRASELLVVGSSDAVQVLGGGLHSSYLDYLDLRDRTQSFSGLAAHMDLSAAFATSPEVSPRITIGQSVGSNFFEVVGVKPTLGRGFLPREDSVANRDAIVVLGHDTWRDDLAGDPNVVGRRVLLNGRSFEVVGVAPKDFSIDRYVRSEFYIPLAMAPAILGSSRVLEDRRYRDLNVRGRLKPGVPLAQARAELAVLATAMARQYPDSNANRSLVARTELDDRLAGDPITVTMLVMLGGLAVIVLVVACANVSGLYESRAPVRVREIAMRLAIGATRPRLIRQLVTESLLIALAGAVCGLLIGYAGVRLFRLVSVPTDIPFMLTFELDRRVLTVSLLAALFSAMLAGVAPAIRSTRTSLTMAMKPVEWVPSRRRSWRQALLVVGQVAMSVVLLVTAVAAQRAFSRELLQGPGYRTDHLLMMRINPTLLGYESQRTRVFYDTLLERTLATPGVRSATLTSRIPMGFTGGSAAIVPEGFVFAPGTDRANVLAAHVDESYFTTLQTPIVSGRAFRRDDASGAPLVAIVNELAAHQYWPEGNAVGRRFRLNVDGPFVEIVGVARMTKYAWIAEPPVPFLYLPRRQQPRAELILLVESAGDPAQLAAPLRAEVHALDANMPIADVRTMEEFFGLRAAVAGRVIVQTIAAMGVMGLGLAIVGVYGLVAYAASRRMREIGIRLAIGADRGSVVRMVLGHGIRLAVIGLVVGLPVGLIVQRLVQSAFSGEPSFDVVPALAVVPLVVVVTAVASYLPARRAAGVDALYALRCE